MAKGKHELTKAKKKSEHKAETIKTEKPKKTEKKAEPKVRKEKNSGGKAGKILLIILAVLAVLAAAALILGVVAGKSGTIHPNLTLNGTVIGSMSVDEAEKALVDGGWEEQKGSSVTVTLPGGFPFTVTDEEAGLRMSSREAAEAAYGYGHSGNPLADLIAYFKCITGTAKEADILCAADGDSIMTRVEAELKEYESAMKSGYVLDTESKELRMMKGAEKISIDKDALCAGIIAAFSAGESEYAYTVEIADAAEVDFAKLHKEIFSEVREPVYDKEKQEISESSVGVDFDVVKAKALWDKAAPGEIVVIPLTVTEPKCTSEELGKMLFRDKLGTYTTDYSTSGYGRVVNVELAADKINGVILNPGESFDYNKTVGQRTTAAGFKAASAYSGGKVVQEVGGGICQVSSTLYCAALYANLQIDARDCHHFAVGYVPPGLDATVSWGGPEFRFTNDRDFPIKIVTSHSGGKLTVEIWGTDVDGSYVKMEYSSGAGSNGTSATTYRCVYDKNDKLLSRELEAKSFYYYHVEEPEPSPSPSPSPSPTPTPEPSPEPSPEPEAEAAA